MDLHRDRHSFGHSLSLVDIIHHCFSEIFLPVVHYEIYSNIGLVLRVVRVNAASLVSFGVAAAFVFLAALIVYLLNKQIRMAMAYG